MLACILARETLAHVRQLDMKKNTSQPPGGVSQEVAYKYIYVIFFLNYSKAPNVLACILARETLAHVRQCDMKKYMSQPPGGVSQDVTYIYIHNYIFLSITVKRPMC